MNKKLLSLNVLHFLNDGYKVSLLLLLPFLAKDLHLSLTQVGFLGGGVNVVQILFALPAAFIAMRLGGLRTLYIALLIYALGFLGTGFSMTFIFIGIFFILCGVGFGVFHPIAFALVTKNSPEGKRGRFIGDFTAIGEIGVVAISTPITFFIARFGWRQSSMFYALFVFVIFLFLQIFGKKKTTLDKKEEENALKSEIPLRRNTHFLLSILSSSLDSLISGPLYVFLPFLLLHKNISVGFLGLFTSIFFIGSLFGRTIIGRLSDKFGNALVFVIADIAMGVFMILIANVSFLPTVIAFAMILGMVTRGTPPAIKALIYEALGGNKKVEKAFAIDTISVAVGTTLGPIILGFISDRYGINSAFTIGSIFAFIATLPAIFIVLSKSRIKS